MSPSLKTFKLSQSISIIVEPNDLFISPLSTIISTKSWNVLYIVLLSNLILNQNTSNFLFFY